MLILLLDCVLSKTVTAANTNIGFDSTVPLALGFRAGLDLELDWTKDLGLSIQNRHYVVLFHSFT